MNEILSNAVTLTVLVSAFAGLVAWVRRDTFTGTQYRVPTIDTVQPDDNPAVTTPAPQRATAPRPGVLQLSRS